jgi:hypothetical protein
MNASQSWADPAESRKESQREEKCMGWHNNFTHSIFVHGKQGERNKESLELV